MASPYDAIPVHLASIRTTIRDCRKDIANLFNRKDDFGPLFQSSLALYTICGTLSLQLDQVGDVIVAYSNPNASARLTSDLGRNLSFIQQNLAGLRNLLSTIYKGLSALSGDSSPFALPTLSKPDINKLTRKLDEDHRTFSTLWDTFYHKDMVQGRTKELALYREQWEADPPTKYTINITGLDFLSLRGTEFSYCRPRNDSLFTILRITPVDPSQVEGDRFPEYTIRSDEESIPTILACLSKLDGRNNVLTATDIQKASVYHEVQQPYLTLKESFRPPPPGHDLWPPLVDRIHIAFQVVQAVRAIHSVDLVHGSICPAYIFMPGSYLQSQTNLDTVTDPAVGTPLLAGFHRTRTMKSTVAGCPKQGIFKDFRFLGIVLIGIALWRDPVPDSENANDEGYAWDRAKEEWAEELVEVSWRVGSKYAEATKWCLKPSEALASQELDEILLKFKENVYKVLEHILV